MDQPKLSLTNASNTVVESRRVFWKDVKVADNVICVPTVGFKHNITEHRYLIKKTF